MDKQFKQGYLCDLGQKSLPDLVDIQQRQKAILANKKLLQTLPDRGEKIRKFLDHVNEVISGKEKQLQLFADKKNQSLVLEDTDDNGPISSSSASEALDAYVSSLAEKFDSQLCIDKPVFKPCRTLAKSAQVKAKETVTTAENDDDRDAVHLPKLRNKPPEIVPLAEIFKLQKEQDKKLKELKTHHAFAGSSSTTASHPEEAEDSYPQETNVFELDSVDGQVEDCIDSF